MIKNIAILKKLLLILISERISLNVTNRNIIIELSRERKAFFESKVLLFIDY